MAPLLFALALFAQDPAAAPSDGPVATATPRRQAVAPLPIQGGAVSAPTDDYGYVGWCYGAMSAYVELYDRAMPEVIRIERAWPTPSTEENITKIYPAQRDEAKKNLVLFARAMQAAEKASPSVIQPQGADAIRRGRNVWTGATSVPKAQLAQFWMSWSPPAKCEETAKALEARSLLFGQALTYNNKAAAPAPAPETPVVEQPAPAPAADAAPTPDAQPDAAPAAPVQAMASGGVLSMTPVPVEDAETPAVATDTQATATADEAPVSAIDALLPTPEVAPETPAPAEAAPAPARPAPAAPAKKRKRGLKDTLTGMRGAQ
ncbi:MAG: hypothetical protein ACOYM5_17175 [Caulobacter sp.]